MWVWQATHKDAASFIPAAKYPVLHRAALDACDALDGIKDGLIGDVAHCAFDPTVTQCKAADPSPDGPDCLTAPQVEAAKKIYAGSRNPRTGEEIYSPLYPGSELGWGQLAGGDVPLGIPVEFFKCYVFRDPGWHRKTRPINFDGDVALSNRPEIQPVNAVDPDLRRFFARGGSLLLVDGWADAAVPPKVAINDYNAVVAKIGARAVKESMRFFMVPGMGHGPGANGPENFNVDALGLVEQWKEKGQAPDELVVSHFKDGQDVGRRLVGQYPQVGVFKGTRQPGRREKLQLQVTNEDDNLGDAPFWAETRPMWLAAKLRLPKANEQVPYDQIADYCWAVAGAPGCGRAVRGAASERWRRRGCRQPWR